MELEELELVLLLEELLEDVLDILMIGSRRSTILLIL